jgi:hypothetical protein
MIARLFLFSLLVLFVPFHSDAHPLGSIIKFPVTPSQQTYEELVCTDQDKATIYEIITTMAENGKVGLLFKKNHLNELGSHINHIHPLKFLSTIFSNPRLKECMGGIFEDYFKRNGFMDGLGPSLEKEAEKGTLEKLLPGFATEVSVDSDHLRPYFRSRDWENMVRKLIQSHD